MAEHPGARLVSRIGRFSPMQRLERDRAILVLTRAADVAEAVGGYSNAAWLALRCAPRIGFRLASGKEVWSSRWRVLAALLLGYVAALAAPVWLPSYLSRVLRAPGRPVAFGGIPGDWLSHLTYGQRGYRDGYSWLGSYPWWQAYPPAGPLAVRLLGVRVLTLAMLLGWLALPLAVGWGSAVGILAALYAAASVPVRDAVLRAGRPEAIAWLFVLGAWLAPDPYGAGLALGLAVYWSPWPWGIGGLVLGGMALLGGDIVLPAVALLVAMPWLTAHVLADERPAFTKIRTTVPVLRWHRWLPYWCHPATLRMALAVAGIVVCAETQSWIALVLHVVACYWSMGSTPRAVSPIEPVDVRRHLDVVREFIPADGRLAFEHDGFSGPSVHFEWLVSCALPRTEMLGGAAFDHAPIGLVRDSMAMRPDGGWREVVERHGITHVVSYRPDWPSRAAAGFELPALGRWPARQIYVHEVRA